MKCVSRGIAALLLCFPFFTLGIPAYAQTAGTTEGAIVGTVTDTSGAAVPNVKVTLSGAAVMGSKSVTTDQNGVYNFPALAPGDYKVVYEASGFGMQTREGVHVSLGFTVTLNVAMSVGTVSESITVTGEATNIDLQSNHVTTDLEEPELKTLPGSRDLWAVLSQAPAIAETKMDVGGSDALTQQGYTVYGLGTSGVGGGGINRGEVEGMMVNEGSGGGGSEMFYVDYGAMQTISVNAANNTAEMPQPGVLSQMFVKTGGNDYHGDVYYDYENGAMEGHNINGTQIAALTSGGVVPTAAVPLTDTNRLNLFSDFAADVGGYLKKDKLWWFFAYRYTSTEQNYPTLNETQKSWSPNYTGKVTYNITSKQKLTGFYTHSNKLQPDYLDSLVITGGRQAGALETAPTAWNSHYPVHVYDLAYTYVITPKLVAEAQAGDYFSGWNRWGKSTLPRIEDTLSNYVSGGLNTVESDRHRMQARGSISYLKSGWWGSHDFKFGTEYMRDMDLTPWGGLGEPGTGLSPYVPCPTAIVPVFGTNCQFVSSLKNGVPFNVYFYAAPPYLVKNGNSTTGLYANDTWQLSKRLTINIGLRFDRQNLFALSETGPNGLTFPAKNFIAFHDFGPRVGLSYDLSGHGTTVLKASFGHYFNYPAADYASGLNPDSSSGWYYEYSWAYNTALPARAGDTPTNYYLPGDTVGNLQNSSGGAATTTFASNLKLANTYQASAYIEQQLGKFTLRSGFVYNNLIDIAGVVNANRPLTAYDHATTISVPNSAGVVVTGSSPQITVWNLDPANAVLPALNVDENLPENSHYYNWEITAVKPDMGSHYSLMASFNYTWNYVRNFTSGFGTGSSFTPNQLINTVGCNDSSAPCITSGFAQYYNWQGKINSTIRLPVGFKVTPILRLQSGIPFGRYFSTSGLTVNGNVLAEPFGAERTPTLYLFDVRVEKDFAFKERFVATGFFDLYNIFNDNGDQAVTAASGPSFLTPSNITPPRVARVGFKFAW